MLVPLIRLASAALSTEPFASVQDSFACLLASAARAPSPSRRHRTLLHAFRVRGAKQRSCLQGRVDFITVQSLPLPFQTVSVQKPVRTLPIPQQAVLNAPIGFQVNVVADGFGQPRTMLPHPAGGGGLLVCDSTRNIIIYLRLVDGQVTERREFVSGLNRPFGMAIAPGFFFVGNTNAVVRFLFDGMSTSIAGAASQTILPLPAGGHWTRNLQASPDF